LLFTRLSFTAFLAVGQTSILAGPVASETVSPALMSSSFGVVVGAGGFFGGGAAPVMAGFVAKTYGVAHIFVVMLEGSAIGVVVSIFLREMAPRLGH
jgi:hypothetical protein